jgi:hypothetical protein
MKTFKNISVIVFLGLIVFSYMGNGIVNYYDHVTDRIENTSGSIGAHGSIIQESSPEEDSHPILPKNNVQIENNGCEQLASLIVFFPPKLSYFVWLPPELS